MQQHLQLLVLSQGQGAHALLRMVLQQQGSRATYHVAFQSSTRTLAGWQGVPGRQLSGELAVGVRQ